MEKGFFFLKKKEFFMPITKGRTIVQKILVDLEFRKWEILGNKWKQRNKWVKPVRWNSQARKPESQISQVAR